MHTIKEVEDYLYGLPSVSSRKGRLEHVLPILELLGNPQDAIPAIHIAGTSGKGSTAYYAASLLRQSGYTVGLAVSPHVVDVSERAQVNGAPLPPEEYAAYFSRYVKQLERIRAEVSYIECLYLFPFWLFAQLKLDYMVIEVGIGGRLDLTNVMTRKDKTCVITDIGFDHIDILGDTLDKISYEKAGIIFPDNDVVMYHQSAEIMRNVRDRANRQRAHLWILPDPVYPESLNSLPLFQKRNFYLSERAVMLRLWRDRRPPLTLSAKRAARQTIIPGRFEVFKTDQETIIVDVAHNTQKIQALIQAVRLQYGQVPLVFLVAFLNKQVDLDEPLRLIRSESQKIYLTRFESVFHALKESVRPDLLRTGMEPDRAIVNDNPHAAFEEARQYAKQHKAVLVVTGSFYLLSVLRPGLIREFAV